MDKLRAISVFRRIVELGSFTAAAEDLGLSKAAVSKNISELEAELGCPLITRTTRSMHVTEEGERYYNRIRSVLDGLDSADMSVKEAGKHIGGHLTVSIPMSLGLIHLNSAIVAFMEQYPDISIELVMSDKYLDLVDRGIDIAFRGGGELRDSSLQVRKMIDLKRGLFASPSYLKNMPDLISFEGLRAHKLLAYSSASSPRYWVLSNGGESQTLDISSAVYKVNNGLALAQAAAAGKGIVLLPKLFVSEYLKYGRLCRVLPQWEAEAHSLYALYPHHREQSRKLRVFIDFIVSYLSEKQE